MPLRRVNSPPPPQLQWPSPPPHWKNKRIKLLNCSLKPCHQIKENRGEKKEKEKKNKEKEKYENKAPASRSAASCQRESIINIMSLICHSPLLSISPGQQLVNHICNGWYEWMYMIGCHIYTFFHLFWIRSMGDGMMAMMTVKWSEQWSPPCTLVKVVPESPPLLRRSKRSPNGYLCGQIINVKNNLFIWERKWVICVLRSWNWENILFIG